MSWKELFRDLVSTGPKNIERFLDVAEKLPTDETLRQLNNTANSVIPYLAHVETLERLLTPENQKNLERMMKKVPDAKTLGRLCDALPLLEKMPDKDTLNKLLAKADSLEGFMKVLEEK